MKCIVLLVCLLPIMEILLILKYLELAAMDHFSLIKYIFVSLHMFQHFCSLF